MTVSGLSPSQTAFIGALLTPGPPITADDFVAIGFPTGAGIVKLILDIRALVIGLELAGEALTLTALSEVIVPALLIFAGGIVVRGIFRRLKSNLPSFRRLEIGVSGGSSVFATVSVATTVQNSQAALTEEEIAIMSDQPNPPPAPQPAPDPGPDPGGDGGGGFGK